MRRIHISLLLLLAAAIGYSQDNPPQASDKSEAYRQYRQYESTPPYGLQKVQAIIEKHTKYVETDEGGIDALDQKTYNGLSLREKFTYTMIHGESWSQICDVDPTEIDEEKKIFGNLLDKMGENGWSDRQTAFLKKNRDSVMFLIRESVTRSKRMGLNYKDAILEINGVEFIPFLIEFYNQQKKDGDILTLLNLLMRENKYTPFMQSQTFKKLYAEDADYRAFIDYNKANEQLIIQRATDFHKEISKKRQSRTVAAGK